MNIDLLLGRPVKVDLEENTYTKTNFDGLYLKNYKLKDFLRSVGYDKYTSWCNMITMKPKDIADILWIKHKMYYKEIDDWEFLFSQCFDFKKQKPYENNPILEGLKFMFGYEFSLSINTKGKSPEEIFFFNIYDENNRWLAKINKANFEKIIETIKLVNYIKPSELSTWNYAYEKHEKRALKYFYEKRMKKESKQDYEFNLETIMRFLKLETHSTYEEMFGYSLYELYSCYSMKTDTFRALALNIGIYDGNIKMDSSIQNNLLFGIVKNEKQVKNIASGNGMENISVEN